MIISRRYGAVVSACVCKNAKFLFTNLKLQPNHEIFHPRNICCIRYYSKVTSYYFTFSSVSGSTGLSDSICLY